MERHREGSGTGGWGKRNPGHDIERVYGSGRLRVRIISTWIGRTESVSLRLTIPDRARASNNHGWGHVVHDQRERQSRHAAVAVGGSNRNSLRFVGTIRGIERPGVGTSRIRRLRDRADRG